MDQEIFLKKKFLFTKKQRKDERKSGRLKKQSSKTNPNKKFSSKISQPLFFKMKVDIFI